MDTLVGRMIRIREDDVFKSVGPDSPAFGHSGATQPTDRSEVAETAEIWFDWSFVDFWKSNYCASRRCRD